MSGQLLHFPDEYQRDRLESARRIAIRAGWDVRSTQKWMIEQDCSKDALNLLSELARQIRMKKAMEARNG